MAKQIRYSEEFKKQAVLSYLQGELSCKQISKSIHVHPNTLSTWIKKYKDCQISSTSLSLKDRNIKKYQPDNLEIDAIYAALTDIEIQVKGLKKLITDYQ